MFVGPVRSLSYNSHPALPESSIWSNLSRRILVLTGWNFHFRDYDFLDDYCVLHAVHGSQLMNLGWATALSLFNIIPLTFSSILLLWPILALYNSVSGEVGKGALKLAVSRSISWRKGADWFMSYIVACFGSIIVVVICLKGHAFR